jgi:hypothetical protein
MLSCLVLGTQFSNKLDLRLKSIENTLLCSQKRQFTTNVKVRLNIDY